MIGQDVHLRDWRNARSPRDRPILSVEGLSKAGNYEDVSFSLYAGEILGLTGLLGSGRTELALSLFGMNKPDQRNHPGRRRGRDVRVQSRRHRPGHRLCAGGPAVAVGLVLEQPIGTNIVVSVLDSLDGPARTHPQRAAGRR